jgi:chondroitin 4-sulfotransferase 11
MENIELEMERREMTALDQCRTSDNFKIKKELRISSLRRVARKLFIDKEHKLAWCPTYKAGSSTWMTIFAAIGGVLTPENRLNLRKGLIQMNYLARKAYPEAKDLDATVKAVSEMTRFIIVRHPFERILSAYRDKLEHREDREFYYRRFGSEIVKSQREVNSTFANRAEPTFVEFLKYLVNMKIFDEHWRPFTVECAPCEMNYQIILKMESLEEEQLFLATKLNLLDYLLTLNSTGLLMHNTNPNGRTEHNYAEKYYREVPKQLLQQVYMLYEADFRLFDYSPKIYFNFATDNTKQEAAGSFG